jgi:Fe-S-cluster-containing hydrogenase component 2
MHDLYEHLAAFLDDLPAGFPRTESGVELRLLRRLFSPDDAELFLHLTLLGEPPRVVARRAGRPVADVARQLADMERRGLVYGVARPGHETEYAARQFVVGFWEGQVNRLDAGLVADFQAYAPHLVDAELWRQAPQMRVLPAPGAVPPEAPALAHEQAERLVRAHTAIAVTNCICRQEMRLAGHGCGRPLETCLSFGSAAFHYLRTGNGRALTQAEALALLERAAAAGLVLQTSNSRHSAFICACCGCCCGVLRHLKQHPRPGEIFSSPYRAAYDPARCADCGLCVDRCQVGALAADDGGAVTLLAERCIGCGLCVVACPTGALSLERKPDSEQPPVPAGLAQAYLNLAWARGKLGPGRLARLVVRSRLDRLLAGRGSE